MSRIRRRPLLLVLLLVPLLAFVAVLYVVLHSPPRPAPPPGPAATPEELRLVRGRDLYGTYCVACHGDKGDGDGAL